MLIVFLINLDTSNAYASSRAVASGGGGRGRCPHHESLLPPSIPTFKICKDFELINLVDYKLMKWCLHIGHSDSKAFPSDLLYNLLINIFIVVFIRSELMINGV